MCFSNRDVWPLRLFERTCITTTMMTTRMMIAVRVEASTCVSMLVGAGITVVVVLRSRVVVEGEVVVARVSVVAWQMVVVAIEPGDPENISFLDAFERTQAHPSSVRLKAVA